MAHILHLVDKGVCLLCFGTGLKHNYEREQSMFIKKIEVPTQFDLNCCSLCNGSGRRIEVE